MENELELRNLRRLVEKLSKQTKENSENIAEALTIISKHVEENNFDVTTYTAYEAMLEINRLKEYQETPHISKEVYLNVQARLNNLEQALKKVNIVL